MALYWERRAQPGTLRIASAHRQCTLNNQLAGKQYTCPSPSQETVQTVALAMNANWMVPNTIVRTLIEGQRTFVYNFGLKEDPHRGGKL
eukprot:1671539-Amphidinium_carterae.2